MIDVMRKFIQATHGDSAATAFGEEEEKKDIMLIINYSNDHPSQCYPSISLRRPSQLGGMTSSPTITDPNTNILEVHYDRTATVIQESANIYLTSLTHNDLLSCMGRASAQQIKHIFLEAGPKFLEYPANLQQQYQVTLPSYENNLKYNVFYNIFKFCTQLETLTLRNIVMSNRVRIPKVKNQSLIRIRLEIQDGAFAIEDVVVSGSSALLPLHFLLGLHRLVMTDCQWSALNWIDLTNSVLDNFTWKMTKEQAMGGRIGGGRSPTTADVKTVISVEDTISQLEGQNLYYMMDQQNGLASCTRAHMKRYIEGRRSSVNDPCIYLGFKCEFIRSITVISLSFEKTLLVHPL